MFAGNFFNGNKNGYGLEGGDLAVLVGFRHNATCFGFNDAMWAKYGVALSEAAGPWKDPKTGGPHEIVLPDGAEAVVLTLSAEFAEEWTADGRSDGGATGYPVLAGIHPIGLTTD